MIWIFDSVDRLISSVKSILRFEKSKSLQLHYRIHMNLTTESSESGVGARTGGYYYAHGTVATDTNYAKPKQISAEEAKKIEQETTTTASVSKWNAKDYHWEEKDKTEWAKTQLNESFKTVSLQIGKNKGSIQIINVEVDGFLCVNIRKGKLIPLFELILKVTWSGRMEDSKNGPTIVEGTISTREINHEDAAATKPEQKMKVAAGHEEALEEIWLSKTAECNVKEEDENVAKVRYTHSVDRMLRQQTLLNKMFMKKCMPELKGKLVLFLEQVRLGNDEYAWINN